MKKLLHPYPSSLEGEQNVPPSPLELCLPRRLCESQHVSACIPDSPRDDLSSFYALNSHFVRIHSLWGHLFGDMDMIYNAGVISQISS